MFIRLTSQQYALLLVKAVAIRKTLHPIAMTSYAIALKDMSDRVYRQKSPYLLAKPIENKSDSLIFKADNTKMTVLPKLLRLTIQRG